MSNEQLGKSRVTIQINSLEALERLVGGDSELEVNLRMAVAQQMVKAHLKNSIQLAIKDALSEGLRSFHDPSVYAKHNEDGDLVIHCGWISKAVTDVITREVASLAAKDIRTEITKIVAAVVQEQVANLNKNEELNRALKYDVERRVRDWATRLMEEVARKTFDETKAALKNAVPSATPEKG